MIKSPSRWQEVLGIIIFLSLLGFVGWIATTLIRSGTDLASAGAQLAAAGIGVVETLVVALFRHTLEVSRRREIMIWKAKRKDYRQILSSIQDCLPGADADSFEAAWYHLYLLGDETTRNAIKENLHECEESPGNKKVEKLAEAMGRDLRGHLESGGG